MKAARIFIHILLYMVCIYLLMPTGYAYSCLMITKTYYRAGLSMVVVCPYSWHVAPWPGRIID